MLPEIPKFIAGVGLPELLLPCQFSRKGSTLQIKTSPQSAEQLWSYYLLLAHNAVCYLDWCNVIQIDGHPVVYNFNVKETIQHAMNFDLVESESPVREKDILIMATASNNSFAVVRDEDNCVVWAGAGVVRFSPIPSGLWSGYNITPLWQQEDDTPGEMPKELKRMYGYRDKGDVYIPNFEYVAYTGQIDPDSRQIVPNQKCNFVADIFFLKEYFGIPSRLSITKKCEPVAL
jgi:hypothetical protein